MSATAVRVIDNLQSYHDSKRDAGKERQSRACAHEVYEDEVGVDVDNLNNGEDEELDCAYADLENGVDSVNPCEGVASERSIDTTRTLNSLCTQMCVKAVACSLEPTFSTGERRLQSVANDQSEEMELAGKISAEFELLKSTVAARRRGLVPQESQNLQIRKLCAADGAKGVNNEIETTVEMVSDGNEGIEIALELNHTAQKEITAWKRGKSRESKWQNDTVSMNCNSLRSMGCQKHCWFHTDWRCRTRHLQ